MTPALKRFLDANKFRFSLDYNPTLPASYICSICSEHSKVIFIEPWRCGAETLGANSDISFDDALLKTMLQLETLSFLQVAGDGPHDPIVMFERRANG
jgi:hypothetical protein